MNNRSKSYRCSCGLEAHHIHQSIKTKFNGLTITVNNVSAYVCDDGHIRLARLTQVQLTKRLKVAHSKNISSINYN